MTYEDGVGELTAKLLKLGLGASLIQILAHLLQFARVDAA